MAGFKYEVRGPVRTALQYKHTVIPETIEHPEFWFFLGMHLVISLMFYTGIWPQLDGQPIAAFGLDWNDMKVIASITTFFEVFYTNQCYQRNLKLYDNSRDMLTDALSICFELRTHISQTCPSHARLCTRYVQASLYLFFAAVNPEQIHGRRMKNGALLFQHLIKDDESTFLQRYDSDHRYLLTLQWAIRIFWLGSSKAKLQVAVQKGISDKILRMFARMKNIQDTVDLPVPFGYFHLLNLMVCVNLTLWAYAMALSESMLASVVYFFAELIFLGMMELAEELADPFGADQVDFPVAQWLAELYELSLIILESTSRGDTEAAWEAVLENERVGEGLVSNEDLENRPALGTSVPSSHGPPSGSGSDFRGRDGDLRQLQRISGEAPPPAHGHPERSSLLSHESHYTPRETPRDSSTSVEVSKLRMVGTSPILSTGSNSMQGTVVSPEPSSSLASSVTPLLDQHGNVLEEGSLGSNANPDVRRLLDRISAVGKN